MPPQHTGEGARRKTSVLRIRWFFRRLLLTSLETGVSSGRKLGLKFLDATFRVNEFLLARIEGVTDIANVDFQLFACAARGELITTATLNLAYVIFRMNACFHGSLIGLVWRAFWGYSSVPKEWNPLLGAHSVDALLPLSKAEVFAC